VRFVASNILGDGTRSIKLAHEKYDTLVITMQDTTFYDAVIDDILLEM
jgi:hypothetical protein